MTAAKTIFDPEAARLVIAVVSQPLGSRSPIVGKSFTNMEASFSDKNYFLCNSMSYIFFCRMLLGMVIALLMVSLKLNRTAALDRWIYGDGGNENEKDSDSGNMLSTPFGGSGSGGYADTWRPGNLDCLQLGQK
jgi:hypothetical protein